MKIEFTVPDGDYCRDCPHQEDFRIEEMEITTVGDSAPKYIREIVAKCHLFKEHIMGTNLAEMYKCRSCKEHG